MKKLMSVLLTVLMVVTLGVANVTGEEVKKVRDDALAKYGTVSALLDGASNDEIKPNSIKVNGKELSELETNHTLYLLELNDEDAEHLGVDYLVLFEDQDGMTLKEQIEFLASSFLYGKDGYEEFYKLKEDDLEPHTHDDSCYGPVCGKDEHVHENKCYKEYKNVKKFKDGNYYYYQSKKENKWIPLGKGDSEFGKGDYVIVGKKGISYFQVTCGKEYHEHDESCIELTCEKTEHTHDLSCYDVDIKLISHKFFTIDDIKVTDNGKEIEYDSYEDYQIQYDGNNHINSLEVSVPNIIDGPVDIDEWYRFVDFKELEVTDEIINCGDYYIGIFGIDDYWFLDSYEYGYYASYEKAQIWIDLVPIQLPNVDVYSDELKEALSGYTFGDEAVSFITAVNGVAEVLINNYDNDYVLQYKLDTGDWTDVETIKRYVDDNGKSMYYAELLCPYSSDVAMYYLRYKGDDVNIISSSQLTYLYIVSDEEYYEEPTPYTNNLEFYKGSPEEKDIVVKIDYELSDEIKYGDQEEKVISVEDLSNYFYDLTFVTDGYRILSYGKDYNFVLYSEPEIENQGELRGTYTYSYNYLGVRFTDDYLKHLNSGTHNIRIHNANIEDIGDWYYYDFVPFYEHFDATIKVKKHHVPDDDEPSYKVVSTGVE